MAFNQLKQMNIEEIRADGKDTNTVLDLLGELETFHNNNLQLESNISLNHSRMWHGENDECYGLDGYDLDENAIDNANEWNYLSDNEISQLCTRLKRLQNIHCNVSIQFGFWCPDDLGGELSAPPDTSFNAIGWLKSFKNTFLRFGFKEIKENEKNRNENRKWRHWNIDNMTLLYGTKKFDDICIAIDSTEHSYVDSAEVELRNYGKQDNVLWYTGDGNRESESSSASHLSIFSDSQSDDE